MSIVQVASGVVYANPCTNDSVCPSNLIALRASDGSELWCAPVRPAYSLGFFSFFRVVGGIIYLMPDIYCGTPSYCNQTLYALSARDGSLLWSYSPPSSMFGAALSNFQLVQGVISININGETQPPAGPPVGVFETCTLNAIDGSQHWCVSNVYSIAIIQGVVYATNYSSSGNSLVALQTNDGSQIWSYAPTNGSLSQTVVLQNVIYVAIGGSSSVSICALNSSDGSQRWCTPTNLSSPSIQVKDGILYASQSPIVQAFSASTGKLWWTNQDAQILAAASGIVYVSTSKNRIEELQSRNGSVLWSYKLTQSGSVYFALTDQVIYYNTSHGLRALSASTGTLIWSHFTPSIVNLSFQSASNGIAYLESNKTTTGFFTLNAFNASNGTLLWKYTIVCVGFCY
jgi:outer membrane protein assembly factor BamB